MKNTLSILLSLPIATLSFGATKDSLNHSRIHFETAFSELKGMLEGTSSVNFERAVFVSESPFWNNAYSYEDFQNAVEFHLFTVQALAEANDRSNEMDFDVKVNKYGRFNIDDIRYLPHERKELYQNAVKNWAIFTYMNDTTGIYPFFHPPFSYVMHDPFGMKDWASSQVMNMVFSEEEKGNCYALAAFYKILANRMGTEARICTAPQHIYIQHRDPKGDHYNVELATAGHPGDGSIQTLTYTPMEAIVSGIALREYSDTQSIGLCLVNLAKAYEHYFNTKDDEFILRCAELALKYDPLNLNALLLKEQVLDERVMSYATEKKIDEVSELRTDKGISETFARLEAHLGLLYNLGYRQMPVDMQKMILTGLSGEQTPVWMMNKNPDPFTTIKPKDEEDSRYTSLSGGVFQEVFEPKRLEPYRSFVFDTETKTIAAIDISNREHFVIDPVAFAYDFGARAYDSRLGKFMSIDPAARAYPGWSPYAFVRDNPILRVDPTGKWDITVHAYNDRSKYGYGIAIVTDRHGNEVYRFKVRLQGTGGSDRMQTNADTPLGTYDIPDSNPWMSGGSRTSYGPNPRLALTPESGEIEDSGRDLIRIHGGRQETYNSETGEWEPVDNPTLKKTHGCMRCYDTDIKALKDVTDELEANDEQEYGGKLNIVEDLEERNGEYYTPADASSLDQSVQDDQNLGLQGSESRQTVEQRKKGID